MKTCHTILYGLILCLFSLALSLPSAFAEETTDSILLDDMVVTATRSEIPPLPHR